MRSKVRSTSLQQAPVEHQYLIALGSNLGDRAALLKAALQALTEHAGTVIRQSRVYETVPIGAANRLFLNAAAVLSSPLAPEAAMASLLRIETALGRVRDPNGAAWANRAIDLDLLLWRQATDPESAPTLQFNSGAVQIPHPHMLERDFVLVPACDVAPQWRHPGDGRTLLKELQLRRFALPPLPQI